MSFRNKNKIISFLCKQELREFDTRKSSPKVNTEWCFSDRRKNDLLWKVKNARKATEMVNMWINLNIDWL